MNKRAIYIGKPRVGVLPTFEYYLGFGVTGFATFFDGYGYDFKSDDGTEWYISTKDIYFPKG